MFSVNSSILYFRFSLFVVKYFSVDRFGINTIENRMEELVKKKSTIECILQSQWTLFSVLRSMVYTFPKEKKKKNWKNFNSV